LSNKYKNNFMAIGEPDVQLRPELAVNRTPIDFGVEQSAVAQLADSFRKGQVTADDLIERYGTLAKSKEKAQIQGLDEFISPEAIQARKDALASQGAQARLTGAQAKAGLDLSQLETDTRRAHLETLRTQAELQKDNYDLRRDYALKSGFNIPDIPPEGQTDAWKKQVNSIYEKAFAFNTTQNKAMAAVTSFKPREVTKVNPKTGETDHQLDTSVYINPAGVTIDKKTYQKLVGLAYSTPGDHEENPVSITDVLIGAKPGTVVENRPAAAAPAKPVVEAAPAAPAAEAVNPDLVTIKSEPTKVSPTEETEKQKLYSQISNADQFSTKLDVARSQIHDAVIKPVGPKYNEGSKISQIANSFGALVGVDASRQKFKTQDELEQFLAQHVQATIRSMAGSGNRVMRAEIENGKEGIGDIIGGHTVSGLFYQAAPKLNSTPETWDRWLNDLDTLFKDARNNAIKSLPADEQNNFPVPARNAPGTSTQAGRPTINQTPASSQTVVPQTVTVTGIGKGHIDPVTKKFIVE
jgi:hypothetical protein